MKKRKKLQLHRDTLYGLTESRLGRAAGRGDTNEIDTGCACTDTCGSCVGCGSGGCGSAGCGSFGGNTCTCIDPPSYCFC